MYPIIQEKEETAHQAKIDSMKAKKAMLESWTVTRMRTVTASTRVIDCIDDTLPKRFNGMGLPLFTSGYDKLPLHSECRLHRCSTSQCMKTTQPCHVPLVHDSPEQNCGHQNLDATYECIDKAGYNSFDPLSFAFAGAWVLIGCVFFCAGAVAWIKQHPRETVKKSKKSEKIAGEDTLALTDAQKIGQLDGNP